MKSLIIIFAIKVLVSIELLLANTNISYILPRISVPSHYDIDVTITFPTGYYGRIYIDIVILKQTDVIVLHSKKIDCNETVDNCVLRSKKMYLRIIEVEHLDDGTDFVSLKLNAIIIPGKYRLEFNFSGFYSTVDGGMFIDSYLSNTNEVRYLLTTNFEPAIARYFIPCYDEPNLKATFTITVTHPAGYTALSNMPTESIIIPTGDSSQVITKFAKTPPMSIHLLALSVTDFKSSKKVALSSNATMQFYAERSVANYRLDWVLKTSMRAFEYFSKFTKVSLGQRKLDGIVVPNIDDGMQKWGLITYSYEVFDDFTTRTHDSQMHTALDLICHEIAHQWFGDLVTLNSWDYTWLNEGFSTYYATLCADDIEPGNRHNLKLLFYMKSDMHQYLNGIRPLPLNYHVEKPSEYINKFEFRIDYMKGALLLRMMQFLTARYDSAIREYLKAHQYGNVIPQNLYDCIQRYPNQFPKRNNSVELVMNSWTNLAGTPLLNVKVNGNQINIHQQELLLDDNQLLLIASSKRWYIPLTFTTEKELNFKEIKPIWLTDSQEQITIEVPKNSGWVIANIKQLVPLRINYDEENWRKILAYLNGPNYEKIHLTNRLQMMFDVYFFQRIGLLNPTIVLEFLMYAERDKDPLVKDAAAKGIVIFRKYFLGSKVYSKFKTFSRNILGDEKYEEIFKETPRFRSANAPSLQRKLSELSRLSEYKYLEAFEDLAESLYSVEEYRESVTVLRSNSKDLHKTNRFKKIYRDLKNRWRLNRASRELFLKNGYETAAEWINKNVV